ncbi:hypothetical protein OUZ56_001414 [Daphnia magna]|uniref:Uncharacterized protein n=1 Tax=Daphnia magna TaxID=35525 RepID=A0ABR0A2N5_9CRUS|nr:hypothetical protein OUZ56_001414 [Daphnia magna]
MLFLYLTFENMQVYRYVQGQVYEMVEPKMNFTLLLNRSQLSLRSGCLTTQPSNLYLQSSSAWNLLCMQLLNKELGGAVERKDVCEDGQFEIQVETECPLFKGLETRTKNVA